MVSGKSTDAFATELCRQVSFFWNATGAEGGVDRLVVSGGGAAAPGLIDALAEKSGLPTTVLNPFSRLEMAEGVDSSGANQLGASLAVACGLALRQLADKDLSLLEGE
jgi:type IV pilus assembly protein PilM